MRAQTSSTFPARRCLPLRPPPVKLRLERSAERDKRKIKIIFPLMMRRAKRSAFEIVLRKKAPAAIRLRVLFAYGFSG